MLGTIDLKLLDPSPTSTRLETTASSTVVFGSPVSRVLIIDTAHGGFRKWLLKRVENVACGDAETIFVIIREFVHDQAIGAYKVKVFKDRHGSSFGPVHISLPLGPRCPPPLRLALPLT
jgi:hypothetical protein